MSRSERPSATYYTTHQVAQVLGVSVPTVVNWIEAGRLGAHRTPGGHRRIAHRQLVAFAREHRLPLDRELLLGPAGRIRVLVVDDEEDFAALVREYFRLMRPEFDVDIAASGFAAGLAVARFQPHVILLDLMMPDIDGFEVFRILRADPETSGIPVIACTAFADEPTEARTRNAGFDGFVGKPIRLEHLPGVILDVLGLGGAVEPARERSSG